MPAPALAAYRRMRDFGRTPEPAGAKKQSVRGRTVKERNGKGAEAERASSNGAGRKTSLPDFVPPQLTTLVQTAPEGDAWLHEIKLDGYRVLARIERGRARLFTRGGQDWTVRFPSVTAAVERLRAKSAL